MLMKNKIITVLGILLLSFHFSFSQCAMCRSTVESNSKMEINNRAEGLNTGILYLMTIPYVIFSVLGYLWYKNSKKNRLEREKIDAVLRKSI